MESPRSERPRRGSQLRFRSSILNFFDCVYFQAHSNDFPLLSARSRHPCALQPSRTSAIALLKAFEILRIRSTGFESPSTACFVGASILSYTLWKIACPQDRRRRVTGGRLGGHQARGFEHEDTAVRNTQRRGRVGKTPDSNAAKQCRGSFARPRHPAYPAASAVRSKNSSRIFLPQGPRSRSRCFRARAKTVQETLLPHAVNVLEF